MLGSSDSPHLHAKAAESHGLALWIQDLLTGHLQDFESLPKESFRKAKFLLEASKAANKLDSLFATENRKLCREQVQEALASYLRFLAFYSKAEGPITPKCHFMIHFIQRSLFKGNPKKYSTYRDESFNGQIAKVARSCHRKTWQNVVHWKCQCLHKKNQQRVLESKLFKNGRSGLCGSVLVNP